MANKFLSCFAERITCAVDITKEGAHRTPGKGLIWAV